jgi:hypothetical protein
LLKSVVILFCCAFYASLFFLLATSSTTRGYKVEVKYAGTDKAVISRLEALGIKESVRYQILAVPDVSTVTGVQTTGGFTTSYQGRLVASIVARNAPRTNSAVRAPVARMWNFKVWPNMTSNAPVQLPAGEYRLKFSAQKHFRRVLTADKNFDVSCLPSVIFIYFFYIWMSYL